MNDVEEKKEAKEKTTECQKEASDEASEKKSSQEPKETDIKKENLLDKVNTIVNSKLINSIDGKNINLFFGDNHGDIFGNNGEVQKTIEKSSVTKTTKNQKYSLEKPEDFGHFVFDKKASRSLAYAIVLSLFEDTPLSDLPFLTQTLYENLPMNSDEKERGHIENEETYYSQDIMLESIGGITRSATFTSKIDSITSLCVGFPTKEISLKVLENLWNLYPNLRHAISVWITKIAEQQKYQFTYFFNEIIKSIVNLMELDFLYGYNEILQRLLSNSKNVFLLSKIIEKLMENKKFTQNIDELLKKWTFSKSSWLWRIPLLLYISGKKGTYAHCVENTFKNRIIEFASNPETDDVKFISVRLHESEHFRTMLYSQFGTVFADKSIVKDDIGILYSLFVYFSYYMVDESSPYLPLIVFDSKQQFISVSSILKHIFSNKSLRDLFLNILHMYLMEIDQYTLETKKIKLFFQQIAFWRYSYYENIQFFLCKKMPSSCVVAKEISEHLKNKLKSVQEERKLLK